MDKGKLYQYTLNQISDKKEIEKILNWLEESPDNLEEYETLKNLWAITGFANYDSYNMNNSKKLDKPLSLKFRINAVLKYAAIFILAFLIGGGAFWYITKEEIAYNEVIVPDGESAEVVLPDNSHVWLNSGSRIVYPNSFKKKIRDVELHGEAYFEVTHNPNKVFHVNTKDITIEVLGTSFNVEAYDQNDRINVTLVEGKILLENPSGELITELSPKENVEYLINEGRFKKEEVQIDYFVSWKNGYLLFKDEKLSNIASKLEIWYNLEIVFEEDLMRDIEFTGTILKNKPIDQILDVLKYTSNFDYSIEMKNNAPSIIYLKTMK